MYVEKMLTLIQEATEELFGDQFPFDKMRGLWVGMEYPMDETHYPGAWVGFEPNGDVRNVGIGHVEIVDGSAPGSFRKAYRWNFSGVIEITIAALTSLERARMIDWLVKAIAFGHIEEGGPLSAFRAAITTNDLVGVNVIWEAFTVGGFAETPGTPWGTDDVIYEGTVSLTVEGEFAFSPEVGDLVFLSAIVVDDPEIYPDLPDTPPSDGWV